MHFATLLVVRECIRADALEIALEGAPRCVRARMHLALERREVHRRLDYRRVVGRDLIRHRLRKDAGGVVVLNLGDETQKVCERRMWTVGLLWCR